MEEYEDKLESDFYMHMDPVHRLGERFPWLDTVEKIAEDQGFFHWELRFASVFADGGFDIQVGNPPWVRPRWEENAVLAELEPWFELAGEGASARTQAAQGGVARYGECPGDSSCDELTDQTATVDVLQLVCHV